uniref:Uncharacterized protein n=1 Tax=Panagrolaimus davidi TaxID=227884 RepID=A0A914PZT0_9BILA
MNTVLAIVTVTTAIFALGLLFYTLFINPPFKNSDSNSEMIRNDVIIGITPSRLSAPTNNNLILVPSNKESIIDLKGFGLENNDYVPPEPIIRSSREIEAQLHLNLEQALIDTNGTFFGESTNSTIATTAFTESSSLPPPSTTGDRASAEATIDFTEESETIEPKFEKILAFPECKKTKDGKRFC